MVSLDYKQKLCIFPEEKNYNRRKVLICEFHKQLLKVIREIDSNPESCKIVKKVMLFSGANICFQDVLS